MSETIIQLVMLGGANSNAVRLPLEGNPTQNTVTLSTENNSKDSFNLVDHLLTNPDDTYYLHVIGNNMIGLGIYDGDVLIVDRSLQAKHEDIIIMSIHGELTCKRLEFVNGLPYLIPSHAIYSPIPLESNDCFVWGVVTHNIHSLKQKPKS